MLGMSVDIEYHLESEVLGPGHYLIWTSSL